MFKNILVVLAVGLTSILVSVSVVIVQAGTPGPSAMRQLAEKSEMESFTFDDSAVTTIGNHSYIPINRDGAPVNMVKDILRMKQAFESAHPELTVDGWSIEKAQVSQGATWYVYGLWADHHPTKPKDLTSLTMARKE